jgi:hypothetical protein
MLSCYNGQSKSLIQAMANLMAKKPEKANKKEFARKARAKSSAEAVASANARLEKITRDLSGGNAIRKLLDLEVGKLV